MAKQPPSSSGDVYAQQAKYAQIQERAVLAGALLAAIAAVVVFLIVDPSGRQVLGFNEEAEAYQSGASVAEEMRSLGLEVPETIDVYQLRAMAHEARLNDDPNHGYFDRLADEIEADSEMWSGTSSQDDRFEDPSEEGFSEFGSATPNVRGWGSQFNDPSGNRLR